MRFTTLVDTASLAAHLDDPAVVIVDCRFDLKDTSAGERAYTSAHIPGAVYAHLDRDLSGQKTGTNGRHPLPDPSTLGETLGRLGIDATVQVIAYDQDSAMFASRLWWLLRWLGHDAVAVLDGGLARWLAEGRPVSAGTQSRPPRRFVANSRPAMVAELTDVAARSASPDWQLIDARAPERYRGDIEPLDRVPGHIPGAVNHFYQTNLTEAGMFRDRDDLRARLEATLRGIPPEHAVCYCGSGVTACQNLLAFEHAGLPGVRLYPGSWSEWSSDPERPVARGDEKKGGGPSGPPPR